ncbi:MAG: RagB/SusD family nutrient uptake outer membrane protein [Bacteroidaceae bacterium]|nr:RagB/SusD family nutrient uptake outer membrane protein [Bacteroidaceae bacterium]
MKKNIISSLLIVLAMSIGFSSCEDMLEANNERHADINSVVGDTLYGYWGILKSLQNIGERYVILGECRGDLVDGTEYISDSISSILKFDKANNTDGSNRYLRMADFYHVINSCNAFIHNCDTARVDGRKNQVMKKEYAQVCAIRAWIYLQLVQIYGDVPYITEPMISTAQIDNYWENDGATVNASTLKDQSIIRELISLRNIEPMNYGNYGYSTIICHATQCIFPANLVLGDIFLLEGSTASCERAAQFYYDYLNSENGGPVHFNGKCYASRNQRDESIDYSDYNGWIDIFRNKNEVTNATELITVIPSSTNKLWGTVQRGVNELFGFEPSLAVKTDTASNTSASIYLAPNFERQLTASKGYENLSANQEYEFYLGTNSNPLQDSVRVLEGAGDARFHIACPNATDEDGASVRFVTKQNPRALTNPSNSYSTTYPVIYRKATVWLRFAEAINRAGFPGYAFAILKSGMVNNSKWLPADSALYIATPAYYYYDYTDTVAHHVTAATQTALVNSLLTDSIITDSLAAVAAVQFQPATYSQWQTQALGSTVCNYISLQEMTKAKSRPYLQFLTDYFNGSDKVDYVSISNSDYNTGVTRYNPNNNTYITNGIHWRGCGGMAYNESRTSFNYVNQINKMLTTYEGDTLAMTKEAIYDEANEAKVINAIEDLICDEMALESGIEGNRFFDLMRMARHRNDNDFLARRVAARKSSYDSPDEALRTRLQTESNWYLPTRTRQ